MCRNFTFGLLLAASGWSIVAVEPLAAQVATQPKPVAGDTERVPSGAEILGLGHPLGDSTELALIEELHALYPVPADRELFDRGLKSTTVFGMKSSNPKAQAILDRIFARRKAWIDSVAASRPKPVDVGPILFVTVALVDSLSDPTATGEIRRRTDIEPHDVILLPKGRATVGALEAAIHALGELWKADRQLIPSKNQSLMVFGEMHIESWTQLHEDLMRSELMNAATKPTSLVPGVGTVHAFETGLIRHPEAASKP
jgi:hypothetical protein